MKLYHVRLPPNDTFQNKRTKHNSDTPGHVIWKRKRLLIKLHCIKTRIYLHLAHQKQYGNSVYMPAGFCKLT